MYPRSWAQILLPGPASTQSRSQGPFSALVFKIVSDSFVGRLAYLRVYSARYAPTLPLTIPSKLAKNALPPVAHVCQPSRDLDEIVAGDIAAVGGLKFSFTGDTCVTRSADTARDDSVSEPVIYEAIESRTAADEQKMLDVCVRWRRRPTFRFRSDDNTGQMIISGMGELIWRSS